MSDSLWPHGLQPSRLLCPWGFSRLEYWSGLPFPPPEDPPNPGIKPRSPVLEADSLPFELLGKLSQEGSDHGWGGRVKCPSKGCGFSCTVNAGFPWRSQWEVIRNRLVTLMHPPGLPEEGLEQWQSQVRIPLGVQSSGEIYARDWPGAGPTG